MSRGEVSPPHHVERHAVEAHEVARVGHRFHGEQGPDRFDVLAHGGERAGHLHADAARDRFPPRAEAQHHAPLTVDLAAEFPHGAEARRDHHRVAGPDGQDPGGDLDAARVRQERAHGDDAVPRQPVVALPDLAEAPVLHVQREVEFLSDIDPVLHVDGHALRHDTALRCSGPAGATLRAAVSAAEVEGIDAREQFGSEAGPGRSLPRTEVRASWRMTSVDQP